MQLIGTTIDSKYQIISMLGQGGMGTVYAAQQLDLDRKVAIKFLNLNVLQGEESRIRFEREAKLLSRLEHEHLVSIFAAGLFAEHVPYFVSELVTGDSLATVLSREERLDWQRVARLGLQICDALAYVHAQGIIHRDLKPQNIMLATESSTDFVKVLDFGLAKVLISDGTNTLTETGALIGTTLYLSPEQCQGKRADQRSDIYSLGCVLYQCITGSPPFDSTNPIGIIYKHANENAKPISDTIPNLPPEVDAVFLKALEKDPSHRYQSMDEFGEVLRKLVQGDTINIKVNSMQSASGSKRPGILLAAAIVFCAGLILLAFRSINPIPRPSSLSTSRIVPLARESADALFEKVINDDKLSEQTKLGQVIGIVEKLKPSNRFHGYVYIAERAPDGQRTAYLEKALAMCRDSKGNYYSDVAEVFTVMALFSEGKGDDKSAVKYATKAIKAQPTETATSSDLHFVDGCIHFSMWRLISCDYIMAKSAFRNKDYKMAEKYARATLTKDLAFFSKSTATDSDWTYRGALIIADAKVKEGRQKEAVSIINKSIADYLDKLDNNFNPTMPGNLTLPGHSPSEYLGKAFALSRFADWFLKNNEIVLARKYFEEAEQIFEENSKNMPLWEKNDRIEVKKWNDTKAFVTAKLAEINKSK